ncbi:MAG: pseudouridine synthase [Mariniblastus sp.]
MAKKKTTKPPTKKNGGQKATEVEARKTRTTGGTKAGKLSQAKKSKSDSKPRPPKKSDGRQRLQRVMASAGVGSRRECEIIIEEGRVEVDGQIVMTLGAKVDPDKQTIVVDAQELRIQRLQYFMLNKPPGIVSTSKDPSGRPRVIDLINTDKRVYNVGRLDQSSEGLILVTNDGELAHRLTHPRYRIEKKYHVEVVGIPAYGDLKKLEDGVYIAEGLAKATKVKFLKKAKTGCWLEMVLAEGRNREIRRMLASIGHKVRTLKRVAIGPLKLEDLPTGAHRPLTPAELGSLKKATATEVAPTKRRPRRIKKRPTGSMENVSDRRRSKPAEKSAPVKKKKSKRRKSSSGERGAARGVKKSTKKAAPRRGKKKSKRPRR